MSRWQSCQHFHFCRNSRMSISSQGLILAEIRDPNPVVFFEIKWKTSLEGTVVFLFVKLIIRLSLRKRHRLIQPLMSTPFLTA
ncbi:unnamed protein product [Calypogeia fissa]